MVSLFNVTVPIRKGKEWMLPTIPNNQYFENLGGGFKYLFGFERPRLLANEQFQFYIVNGCLLAVFQDQDKNVFAGGDGVSQLPPELQRLAAAHKPIGKGLVLKPLDGGGHVLAVKDEAGPWIFHANGKVLPTFHAVVGASDEPVIKTFSNGRWATYAHGPTGKHKYAGDIRDPQIEGMFFSQDSRAIAQPNIFEAPDGRLGVLTARGEGYGAWFENNQVWQDFVRDFPQMKPAFSPNEPIFLDGQGAEWILPVQPRALSASRQGLPSWIGTAVVQTYELNRQVMTEASNASSNVRSLRIEKLGHDKDGRWLASIAYSGTTSPVPNLIGPLAALEPGVKTGYFVEDQSNTYVFPDGQWVGVFNQGTDLLGPWARLRGLLNHPKLAGARIIGLKFVKHGNDADPEQYILAYEVGNDGVAFLGPVAEKLGLHEGAYRNVMVYNDASSGHITVKYSVNGQNILLTYPHVSATFGQRSRVLWRAGEPATVEALLKASAVETGVWSDVLMRHFHLFAASTSTHPAWKQAENAFKSGDDEELRKLHEAYRPGVRLFTQILMAIKEDKSNKYFDLEGFSKLVRRHKTFLAKSFLYDFYASNQRELLDLLFKEAVLKDHRAGYLAIDMAAEIYEQLSILRSEDMGAPSLANELVLTMKTNTHDLSKTYHVQKLLDRPTDTRHTAVLVPGPQAEALIALVREVDQPEAKRMQNELDDYRKAERLVGHSLQASINLGDVLKLIHDRVGDDFPFDVEMKGSKDVAYSLARMVRANAQVFKIHSETSAMEHLREWHRVNGLLNASYRQYAFPQRTFSTSAFMDELGHDSLVWATLMGILMFFLSKGSDLLRKKDLVLAGSAKDRFEQMWNNNAEFDGEGLGDVPGAKELTYAILFEGLTPELRQAFLNMRSSLTPPQRAWVDAILALAADSPQDAQLSWSRRALNLVPFVGTALGTGLVLPPAAWGRRQAMNEQIAAITKDPGSNLEGFLGRIKATVEQYAELDAESSSDAREQAGDHLGKFWAQVRRLLESERQVSVDSDVAFSPRQNGFSIQRAGTGGDFFDYVPYTPGDDIGRIDVKKLAVDQLVIRKMGDQKEVPATILIHMPGLINAADVTTPAMELVNSLSALFARTRLGKNRGNYDLKRVMLFMPDGTLEPLAVHGHKNSDPRTLAHQILQRMQGKNVLNGMVNQFTLGFAPAFYNAQEQARYRQTNALGIFNSSDAVLDQISLPATAGQMRDHQVFLVGMDEALANRLAQRLPRAKVHRWEEDGARLLRADAAMSADDAAMISWSTLRSRNIHHDPKQAQKLREKATLFSRVDIKNVGAIRKRPFEVANDVSGMPTVTRALGWEHNGTSLRTINEVLGVSTRIEQLLRERKAPYHPVVVVDWGCGNGTALVELYRALQRKGIERDVRLYGYANAFDPNWEEAPEGITFILDTQDHLKYYFADESIDLVYSFFGMEHLVMQERILAEHLATLWKLLSKEDGQVVLAQTADFVALRESTRASIQGRFELKPIEGTFLDHRSMVELHPLELRPKRFPSGGIDLQPGPESFQTQHSAGEIRLNAIDPAMLEQFQNAPGCVPVILNVRPLKSLRQFLGV